MTPRLSQSRLTPDAFAAVMATGILSIAAQNHDYTRMSNVLGILATVALAVLVAMVVAVAVAKHRVLPWDLSDPQVTFSLFTFVAACAVLNNRLSSQYPPVLPILGVVAGVAWLGLVVLTMRNVGRLRWAALRDHVHGAWLLSSVATSGLAIVAAKLLTNTGQRQWLMVALPLWILALITYLLLTSLMVWRAVTQRLDREGFEPDSWLLTGSVAIAAVAGYFMHRQSRDGLAGILHAVTLTAWAVATMWIPPLIYFGLRHIKRRPDMLRFTGAWWTLVFPLGMYSVATSLVADLTHWRSLGTVALVAFWDALLVWVSVAIGGVMRVLRALGAISGHGPRQPHQSGAAQRNRRGLAAAPHADASGSGSTSLGLGYRS